jgi:hypothetical protein
VKAIVYLTPMKEVPPTCLDCKVEFCRLPTLKRDHSKLSKRYLSQRHPRCPLRIISTDHLGGKI